MRLSVVEDDPGYSRESTRYEPLVDGVLVTALTADEEEGLVVEWLRGPDRKLMVDARGRPVTVTRTGVRVELRPVQ